MRIGQRAVAAALAAGLGGAGTGETARAPPPGRAGGRAAENKGQKRAGAGHMGRFGNLAAAAGRLYIRERLALHTAPFGPVAILHDVFLKIIHLLPGDTVGIAAARLRALGQQKEETQQGKKSFYHGRIITAQPWMANNFARLMRMYAAMAVSRFVP